MYKAADVRAEQHRRDGSGLARAKAREERGPAPGPTAARLKDLATSFRAPAATGPLPVALIRSLGKGGLICN